MRADAQAVRVRFGDGTGGTKRLQRIVQTPGGLGPEEVAGFAAAVSDDGGTIGVSLYDWTTTRPAEWPVLSSLSG